MKKQICYLLSVLLLLFCPIGSAAQTDADDGDAIYRQAAALLQKLTDMDAAAWEPESSICRGDFLRLLSQTANQNNIAGYNGTFTDVSASHPAADAIYGSLALGFVAPGDWFYPDEAISGAAACKLAVCYAGYQPVAEARGGYPTGYMTAARQIKLLNGTSMTADAAVSYHDAAVLMLNLLSADYVSPSVIGTETAYYKTGETNLAAWHDVYTKEGVVNVTPYSSLGAEQRTRGRAVIEVEGMSCEAEAETDYEAFLGRNVTIYYRLDDHQNKKLVLLWAEHNEETVFDIEHYSGLQGSKLTYYDEEKDKNVQMTLANSPIMIYNGRYLPFDASRFSGREGRVSLVDNNQDGRAEVVFVERDDYLEVGHISPVGGTIGDAYDSSRMLRLKAADVEYKLTDAEGTPLTLYELQTGDVLAVRASADGLLLRLWLCTESVSGTVTQADLQDNKLWIDGEAYDMAERLKTQYAAVLQPGITGSFRVSPEGRLVSYKESEGLLDYAYIMDYTKGSGSFANGQLKVYTRGGEIKVLNLPDKVTVDGGRVKQSDLIDGLQRGVYPCPSMVKLLYTADDVLRKLDFPSLYTEGTDTKALPADDSLLEYRFTNDKGEQQKSFRYRSAPKSCMPYFNVADTVVFKIPSDLSDEDSFYAGDNSGLLDNSDYTFSVYDVNEGGTAGAVMWRRSGKSDSFTYHDPTYIVEAVTEGTDDEGNAVQLVKAWSMGQFKTLYMEYGFNSGKPSGKGLCGGDLIRVKLNRHNTITAISVDFDAASGLPVPSSTDSGLYGGANVNLTYQFGKVYRVFNGYAYLSDAKNVFGEYDYSFANQKNFYIQTKNIVKYDSKTQKLRPIQPEEIQSYVSVGQDNHYVVLRQSIFNINSIYVYE